MKRRWKSILHSLIVLWGVATLVFFLFHAVAGDPARMMLGQVEDPAALAALRMEYGLDQPLWVQYGHYLEGLIPVGSQPDGGWGMRWPDLQTSYQQKGRPVIDLLAVTLPNTALLAFLSMGLALTLGIPMGLFAAIKKGTWLDRGVVLLSTTGMGAKRGMFEGDLTEGELEIGQVSALLRSVPSAAEIVHSMYHEALQRIKELNAKS